MTAPVCLEDLTQKPPIPSGAELFIESLGDRVPQFSMSMNANQIHPVLAADSKIAASPPVLQQSAAGIFNYRNYYPDDPHLHLWSGLIYQNKQQHDRAMTEFKTAIKLGLTHWRVQWYIAKSAEKKGDIARAKEALHIVVQESRNFAPAREMLASLSGQPFPQKTAKSTTTSRPSQAIASVPQNKAKKKRLKLAHIVNPVIVDESSDLLVAQPITFASMKTAQEQAKHFIDVQLYSTQYREDRAMVPPGFIKTRDLQGSVLDLAEFKMPRKLPLLKDILHRLYETATEADYLIYTNVDIALMPYFYITVSKIIEQGYDAFTINRRVIPEHYTNPDDLPLMYGEVGAEHGGHDCFVFKRTLYDRFVLGNVCLGIQYVGLSLLVNCLCQANKFMMFQDKHITFHVGSDGQWQTEPDLLDDYRQHNGNELYEVLQNYKDHENLDKFIHPHLKNFEIWYANQKKSVLLSYPFLQQIQTELNGSQSRLSQIKSQLERT